MIMEDFMLSNGVSIPKIGFGTWQIPEGAEAKMQWYMRCKMVTDI